MIGSSSNACCFRACRSKFHLRAGSLLVFSVARVLVGGSYDLDVAVDIRALISWTEGVSHK